jgi:hypothetical protein
MTGIKAASELERDSPFVDKSKSDVFFWIDPSLFAMNNDDPVLESSFFFCW